MGEKGLGSLVVWQKARALAVKLCKDVLPLLPIEERYALSQQLRRSAQSIPANIAEAYGRYSFPDSIRFMYIARGSIEETYSHMMLVQDFEYVSPELMDECIVLYRETVKLINGYIEYLKRSGKERSQHVSEGEFIYDEDGPGSRRSS
ncbi:MAG: four helix bundle protein [Anaerolineales bacterium]